MKTIYIFIFTLTSFFIKSHAQNIQTYSGKFEDGTATYNYYENESYDRIFNGNFNYQGSFFDIKGTFKENLRNGLWQIYANDKLYKGLIDLKINTLVQGNYKNGCMDGEWNYSNTMHKYPVSQYGLDGEFERSNASFKNNKFIGKISYESNRPDIKITGQFDENGNLDGQWVYLSNKEEDIIKFDKGVAYWRLHRKVETGEKITFFDSTSFIKKFWDKYDTVTRTSLVDNNLYFLHTEISNKLSNEAVLLWISKSISAHGWSIENPLYCVDKGVKKPEANEYIIRKCESHMPCYDKIREKELKLREEEKRSKEEERRLIASKEYEQQNQLLNFNNSDYGILLSEVKKAYDVWLQKGEFETQIEHNKRIKDNSSVELYKIIEVQKNKLLDYHARYATLGGYDIEKQEYKISTYGEYSVQYTDSIHIPMPVGIAKQMKERFPQPTISYPYDNLILFLPLEYQFINNKLTVCRGIFIFDFSKMRYNGTTKFGGCHHYLFTGKNREVFLTELPQNKDKFEINCGLEIGSVKGGFKFNPINIESLYNDGIFTEDVYYYEWKTPKLEQPDIFRDIISN